MAGLGLRILVEGKTELLSAFLKIHASLADLRELGTWDWVISRFYQVEKEQFESEGSAGKSGKWVPLTAKYEAIKARKYGSMPILQATQRMYKALTSANTPDSVVIKDRMELTIGTSLPYSGYHNTGTDKMQRRPPIDPTDEQKDKITEPIKLKLRQVIANARLRDKRGF